MSKQVNYSHISAHKQYFDLLYSTTKTKPDPEKLESVIERMTTLQDKIVSALDRAPVNVSKYFKWTASSPDSTVDADEVKQDLQNKLNEILTLSFSLPPPPLLPKEIVPILRLSLPFPSVQSAAQATDFAVGFGNISSANCWANSLLSMILSMPNFRRAYEVVANYYAHDVQNAQNVQHGNGLLGALTAYDTALAGKQSVPTQISQNVRLAFHHFFGHKNPLTYHEIFSESSYRQEDAWEGMQVLMGRYEQILGEQAPGDPLPAPYVSLQTKRHYRPIGNPFPADPQKLARNDYSQLTNDNVSSLANNDYQIILDLQNKGHLSFSALLSEYFHNTHLQGHDTGTYLLPDRNIQQFELIGEGRQFVQAPEELLLTIKRFGSTLNGAGYKIASPLAVHQILVLPADTTRQNIPIAYEIDTFNVHRGEFGSGHYIAYRKINGQWIEADDAHVRLVSEQEIDQILFGQKGPSYTSYMHHYKRIEAARQHQALATAQASRPRPAEDAEKLSQEMAASQQNVNQLQALNVLLQTNADPSALREALQNLEHGAPQTLTALRYAIWVNDKTPDVPDYGTNTLNTHPERLRDIKLPLFISSTGKTLVEQLLLVEKHRLDIASEKSSEKLLQSFLEKVHSSSNDELLIALKALPEKLQISLHGLVYQSHLKKFGHEHVNREEYHYAYGQIALEKGDIRKVVTEANEAVLNLTGTNILEQLISEHHGKVEKLQNAYEKEQLQAFYELSLRPANEMTNVQLFKIFETMEIRHQTAQMLYWHLWYGHRMPQFDNYGCNTFKNDPRSLLTVRDPNLARPPIAPSGSNLLFQMIKLLERESK